MDGISEETQVSIAVSSRFPGFRFSPTDEELITYYLRKKLDGFDKCVEVISEIQICDLEPWDLPDSEWFFFSSRGRKYPNGSQSKRATELGYWKATGKERNVKSGANVIGTKRTLVFHLGRAPKGERTEWIIHEYCTMEKSQDSMVVCRLRKNNEFRIHDSPNQASQSQRNDSDVHRSDDPGSDHNTDCTRNYGNVADRSAFSSGNPGHSGNYVGCEGNIDNTGRAARGKAIEDHSRESNSSYNSHSIEQNDSASESNQKLSGGVTLTACTPQPDCGNVEDCYAEILKDDIIELDESSLFAPLRQQMIASESQKAVQETVAQPQPLQDTASRRFKARITDSWNPLAEALQTTQASDTSKKSKSEKQEESPKCVIDLFSSVRPCIRGLVYVLVGIILFLLAYFYLY